MTEYIPKIGTPPSRGRQRSKYPLPTLEIGQYFFVPGGDVRAMCANVNYAMNRRKGCTMKKFVCRTIEENGVKGVAVYRVPHPIFDGEEFIEHEYQTNLAQWKKRKERHAAGKYYEGEPTPDDPTYEDYMKEPQRRVVPSII